MDEQAQWIAVLLAITWVVIASGCDDAAERSAKDEGTVRQSPAGHVASASPANSSEAWPPATTPTTSPTTAAAAAPPERLFGTWIAHDVQTSAGQVKVKLTFQQHDPVKIVAWSELPLVGEVREKKAPFEVDGNTLSSDAIHGGTSVQYWFEDDGRLAIKYADGKVIRFQRQ